MSRSSLILSAWRWWRAGRLMQAAERAREGGRLCQAAALLDRAEILLRDLQVGTEDRTHA